MFYELCLFIHSFITTEKPIIYSMLNVLYITLKIIQTIITYKVTRVPSIKHWIINLKLIIFLLLLYINSIISSITKFVILILGSILFLVCWVLCWISIKIELIIAIVIASLVGSV